ncbi:PP2C family protein-serine/threonine phosphatase [Amycolatopsis sp. YIM 10]|uniref:PP2C family protein-serine/threonine phosphatase n=1 Tax=Amycolatopsis sp. YIM 10 TaxID=2653857 RepID=UPI001D15D1CC|nr:PP2C family protein-serine/threonine phosphatase [Amycolatopsis sp. YIM 10]
MEQRGRLVVAATTLIRSSGTRAPAVLGTVHNELDGVPTLEVALRLDSVPVPQPLDLPLPAEIDADGRAVWRLPSTPAHARHADPDTDPAEQELRAALAHVDTLECEHQELKNELAETNTGVLAMYVESEERDEQLRRAHAVIFRELEDALRPPAPEVPGLEFGVRYQPAEADSPTGGDLYDWFLLPDGTLHVTVVDAVGHGVVCTRTAVTVSHTLRTLALEGHPLDVLIRRTSEINPGLMATVLLARLDPRTGELRLANGGHPRALLVRGDGSETAYLPVDGRGVGFPKPGSAGIREERLHSGDVLLLYTDGLIESRGGEDQGETRLITAAQRHHRAPANTMTADIVRDMHDIVRHRDDTLILALRYLPPASGHPGL